MCGILIILQQTIHPTPKVTFCFCLLGCFAEWHLTVFSKRITWCCYCFLALFVCCFLVFFYFCCCCLFLSFFFFFFFGLQGSSSVLLNFGEGVTKAAEIWTEFFILNQKWAEAKVKMSQNIRIITNEIELNIVENILGRKERFVARVDFVSNARFFVQELLAIFRAINEELYLFRVSPADFLSLSPIVVLVVGSPDDTDDGQDTDWDETEHQTQMQTQLRSQLRLNCGRLVWQLLKRQKQKLRKTSDLIFLNNREGKGRRAGFLTGDLWRNAGGSLVRDFRELFSSGLTNCVNRSSCVFSVLILFERNEKVPLFCWRFTCALSLGFSWLATTPLVSSDEETDTAFRIGAGATNSAHPTTTNNIMQTLNTCISTKTGNKLLNFTKIANSKCQHCFTDEWAMRS